jgi:hypothetical protein
VSGFDPDALEAMRTAQTIKIETSRGPGRPVHETIVWIVVDEAARAFVRSEFGERGRWFRELLANPSGAVHVGSTRIPVRAEHAADSDRVDACSRALSAKYRTSRGSLAMMLREEVLKSTLELHPA